MTNVPERTDYRALLKQAFLTIEDLRARLAAAEQPRQEPIAIIGMGCRFPGADSPAAFWRLLAEGRDAIREVPAQRWDAAALYDPDPHAPGRANTRWGGFLEQVEQFDPAFFGIAPREALSMDPQQRLLLEVSWEALEQAGQTRTGLRGSATGVFVGFSTSDYTKLQFADPAGIDAYTATGFAHSILANRLSYLYDLRGPSVAVDTACSSSLVTVHLACQSLRQGECDLALAGGVNLILNPDLTIALARFGAMAPDGRCKAFDARANGFVRSEGCGLVVLKRLADALRDGDRVLALIRGSAVNQDGRVTGLTVPNGPAQQAVIRQALAGSGVAPAEVGYIEAHGTGTALGDPIEVEALAAVYGQPRPAGPACLLGAVKTNIGHLEAAAGIAGLIKVVLSLQHGQIPPNLHFQRLNPHISLEGTPFVLPAAPTPWPAGAQPRYAAVSSFGIGGTNAHVLLAEPPAPPAPAPADPPFLLPISAATPAALRALAASYQTLLAAPDAPAPADLCYTAARRRTHHEQRLAVLGTDATELAARLDDLAHGRDHAGLALGAVAPQRRIVFVCSGQGPQWAGMGRELLAREPAFRAAVERCDQILRRYVDWSLIDMLCAEAERSRLDQTEVAQPALFAFQVGLAALLGTWGLAPDALIGHSLGEVTAAHLAGALSLEDALRVVYHRGRLMQRATGHGRMLATELSADEAEALVAPYAGRVGLAALNGPRATVLAGEPAAIGELAALLEARGEFCRTLPVSYAFHSPQMDPFQPELRAALAGLTPGAARLPLASTVTAGLCDGRELGADYWARNIREPVRFAAALELLLAGEALPILVELAPHPALTREIRAGLAARGQAAAVIPTLRRDSPAHAALRTTAAGLFVCGAPLDWSQILPARGRCVDLPAYPWQRERFWLEAPEQVEPAGGHPLIGAPIALAEPPGARLWRARLDRRRLAFLEDHRVQDAVVFPGMGYIEMALAAAAEAFGATGAAITAISFQRALFLPPDAAVPVQVLLTPAGPCRADFRVYSAAPGSAGPWTLHVSGALDYGAQASPAAPEPVQAIQARCREQIPGTTFYARSQARGNDWGPTFQGIERIWRGAGELLGQIQVPRALAGQLAAYRLHPALADACAQVLGAARPLDSGGAFVGGAIRELRIHGRLEGDRLWSHARVTPRSDLPAHMLEGDVRVFDAAGRVLLELLGVRLHYLDQQEAPAAAIESWLYAPEWQPAALPDAPATAAGAWLLLADAGALAPALARALEARGGRVHLLAPAQTEALPALLAQPPDGLAWRGLVDLRALDLDDAALTDTPEQGCAAALASLQTLDRLRLRQPPPLWLVTRGAQQVIGEHGGPALAQAALWGLGRSAALEHPELWGGLIDLAPDTPLAASADELARSLIQADGETLLAWRGRLRYVARLAPLRAPAAAGPLPVRPDASYLISGGLGGLGLASAAWLVARGARRLILVGRSGLPPRTAWAHSDPDSRQGRQIAAVRALEHQGTSVHLAALDVADRAALEAFLASYRAEGWPPIRGVIHAAGTLAYLPLVEHDPSHLRATLRPKIIGALLLDQALADAPLDFFVLYSSASALLPSPFLGGYAAGNALLDALARRRRAQGRPALSINWGAWSEVGMVDSLRAARGTHSAAHERWSIAPAQGLEALGRLLALDTPQAAVLPVGRGQWRAAYPALADLPLLAGLADAAPDAPAPDARIERAALLAGDPAQAAAHLEHYLADRIARVVGLPPERIDPRQPITALGLDSLMAVEIRNRIETDLGVRLHIVRLLQGASLPQIAALLLEQLTQAGPPEAATPPAVVPIPPGALVAAEPTVSNRWEEGEL